ncbi:MAG: ABC transporter ATP-binding protein, partial [Pseudomonadota bacterium]
MTDLVLSAQGLSKRFGRGVQALEGVDLALPEASFVALLGPAGAGKTTLLRTLAGLEIPDAGRVLIHGRDATALEPKDRDVAMIFDSLALYPNKTGAENIASALKIRGAPPEEIEAKTAAVAETLKVRHILKRLPRTMSGGERQRIALGRALVRDPAFFLLDEPLSSLDAQLRVELRAELRRLQRERRATILYATPDYAEALAVADMVVVLLEGRVRQVAPPQTLYDAPVDRDVARFVGAPEINLVAADYDPAEGGRLRLGPLRAPAVAAHRRIFNGAPARFDAGVRPEALTVAPPDPAAGRAA